MKIRFISKNQRELLKTQKTQNIINNQLTNRDQVLSKYHPEEVTIKKQEKINNVNKQSQINSDEQQLNRIRSREKQGRESKRWQFNEEDRQERQKAKKTYLGLIRQKSANRFNPNYKTNLNFQWDNSEDTFNNQPRKGMQWKRSVKDQIVNQNNKNWKEKHFSEMTERDWRIFRGGRVAHPIKDWQDTSLNFKITQNLKQLGFTKPKPIQMQAIPIGLLQKDLIGLAPTGEGKTLAYLIPALQFIVPLERINPSNSSEGPYVLIMVPSRELAEQIETEFNKISNGLGVNCVVLVGGKQIEFQALSLQKGAQILIATPGRLKELIDKKYLSLERCSWVIIDQADKMISENLVQEVESILTLVGSESILNSTHTDKNRITHMFSATMAPQIEKLVRTYLTNPCYISIGAPGSGKKEIQQYVQFIDENSKNQRLTRILRNLPSPIIVFVNMRSKCEPLVNLIEQKLNRTAVQYHGNKSQQQREKAIQGFRTGKFEILVATDLAGRGLDVIGITAIINYDAPKNINEFVHRAGRTGRAGMKGKAYTLLTVADQAIFYDLRQFLQRNGFKVPEGLYEHPSAQIKPGTTQVVPRRKQIVYTN